MRYIIKAKKSLRTEILRMEDGLYFGGTLSGRRPVTVSRANALTLTTESAEQHKWLLASWGHEATIESINTPTR
tara:strand:+ start:532 stop:753 length:222 start_codon:yes stop_codon:yes gene_type:complete